MTRQRFVGGSRFPRGVRLRRSTTYTRPTSPSPRRRRSEFGSPSTLGEGNLVTSTVRGRRLMRAERWLGQLHLEEMICGLLDIPERARGDGSSIAVTRTHHGAGNRSGSDPTQLSHPEPQRRACDSPRHLIDLAVARAITLTRNARQGSVQLVPAVCGMGSKLTV